LPTAGAKFTDQQVCSAPITVVLGVATGQFVTTMQAWPKYRAALSPGANLKWKDLAVKYIYEPKYAAQIRR
jgi:hypothetical protein